MNQMILAWERGVARDYRNGLVSSEYGLQASLYASFRKYGESERIFAGPKVKYRGSAPARIPDLVTSSDRGITSIVELKFFPHWSPIKKDLVPDIERLAKLAEEDQLTLAIDPNTGDPAQAEVITSSTRYFFGIVGYEVVRKLRKYEPCDYAVGDVRSSLTILYGDVSSEYPPQFGCLDQF